MRRLGILLMTCVLASVLSISGSHASAEAPAKARPTVSLRAPKGVNEGDRMKISVTLRTVRHAKRVELLKWTKNIYGTWEWTPVHHKKAAGRETFRFRVVARDVNSERYRARVIYEAGKRALSKPVRITVWRWIPLADFRPYSATPGTSANPYTTIAMNGTQYIGWLSYGSYPSWDTRHTPGRNCNAFRGDLGVADESADGSSAVITLLTDETTTVYTSPALTPGMIDRIELDLSRPYRFSIHAANTSPDGVLAYPAIGNPEFLCTGI